MAKARIAKFPIGAVVKHRLFSFRGVVFDIDPVFDNTDEWYEAIPPEIRPHKDQPFYHLFAENSETEYVAYVSEQNLLPDDSGKPLRHPQVMLAWMMNGTPIPPRHGAPLRLIVPFRYGKRSMKAITEIVFGTPSLPMAPLPA